MSTTRPYSPGDRGPDPGGGGSGSPPGEAGGPGARGPDVTAAPGADVTRVTHVYASGLPGTPDPVDHLDDAGRLTRGLSFRGASGLVPLARDFTRGALQAWGWLPAASADQRAAAEDVLLVVSELVTNACLHADGPEELWIASDRKVLRVEVVDHGTGQPAPRTPHRAGRPGGHGMFIVQRLCLDWGVVRTPGVPGKRVWAELGAPS